MHYVVDGCVFVPNITTSGKVRGIVLKRRVGGTLERVGAHPLSELRVLRRGRDWCIKVAMYNGGVVS